jgi:serine O-acetyltransferase
MSEPIPVSSPSSGLRFDAVVEALSAACEARIEQRAMPAAARREFPSRAVINELVEDLRSVLFPGFYGPSELTGETLRFHLGSTLDKVMQALAGQIKRGLCAVCEKDPRICSECEDRGLVLARAFIASLPEIRRVLATDVQAAYEGDPALTNPDEAIFCYPGVLAITNQRIAHRLLELGVPLIPRIITEHAHSLTGIDIHPGARIGERFFIDHGTGVVIGETCIIGSNVRIYQGVTLGAKSFPLDEHGNPIKGVDRHPVVEDDVVIYSNATILGRVIIGKGSVIGGNVWLTHGVPPGSTITQVQEKS